MNKLFKSSFMLSFITFISRILGMVRDVVLLNVFGASAVMDAFLVAFRIPNFLRRLFAEGAFAQAFVPVITEYKTKHSFFALQQLVSKTAGSLLLVLLIITVFVLAFSPYIISVLAPGFTGDQLELTVLLFRIAFPYFIFVSMTALASSILNSHHHFVIPALAPLFLSICFITGAIWASAYFSEPIMALAWAVLVAGLIQFGVHIPKLWQNKLLIPPSVDFKHAGVIKIFRLILPALFAVSVLQINLLVNTVFASQMQTGSVAWLYVAERMSEFPMGIIGVAIATVILPSLSKHIASNDSAGFQKTMDWGLKLVLCFGIPASVALFCLSDLMIQTIFMHHQFSEHDAKMSALTLKALSGSVLAFMIIKVCAPGFFAHQNARMPFKIGMLAVVMNIVLSFVFIALFKEVFRIPEHAALGVANTFSAVFNAVLLLFCLHKLGLYRIKMHWMKTLVQFSLASSVMAYALLVLQNHLINSFAPLTIMNRIGILSALCVLGVIMYAGVLLAMGFRPKDLKV